MSNNKEEVRGYIRKKYANVAKNVSKGCDCGSGCCVENENTLEYNPNYIQEVSSKIGYTKSDLANVPQDSNMGLGCGNPIAISGLKEGEVVLDLGSGGGFDCFLARKQVGENGYVIGVDMTPKMIQLSRKNVERSEYTNVEFRLGEIEHLPVSNKSTDVIISNCVINLSMISGCMAGAEYVENITVMLENAEFKDIKMIPKDNSKEIIKSWAPNTNIEDYVTSFIIEAKKE